ncbi:MAG: ATP phosphoribosyltransferase regulatory subunit [Trueperaceae bacterium]|nr:ATP phosphoribosyltransferase regulatory subunit [Trueperaceae bacterium]
MKITVPEGTRDHLPRAAEQRARMMARLSSLYAAWGYQAVEVPVLEHYRPQHPRAAQAFKLTDAGGELLALRSDFTPALARLVHAAWPSVADPEAEARPVRLQYAGPVWHATMPELARTREFTQVGVELVGARHPRADAELIHLARESVRAVGLRPRVEIGSPGLVKALMDEAGVAAPARPALADAIDRKDPHDVERMSRDLGLAGAAADALRAVPDLYGGPDLMREAERLAVGPASSAALAHLAGVLAEFEDDTELLLDLGMARRLAYYTGVTFRAYTVDFGKPLLGGGRYDGALLPYAAGFALGLERLTDALGEPAGGDALRVLATDDAAARLLRAAGIEVLRAVAEEPAAARTEARALGAAWLLTPAGLEAVSDDVDAAERARLRGLLEGDDA